MKSPSLYSEDLAPIPLNQRSWGTWNYANFRTGGYITGIIGILIFPWKLIADPNGYIFTWLIAYSSLLGPIGGILIADYYFIRRKELILDDLYAFGGIYEYNNGFNPNEEQYYASKEINYRRK